MKKNVVEIYEVKNVKKKWLSIELSIESIEEFFFMCIIIHYFVTLQGLLYILLFSVANYIFICTSF